MPFYKGQKNILLPVSLHQVGWKLWRFKAWLPLNEEFLDH